MIYRVSVKRGRNLVCSDGEPPNTYIKVINLPPLLTKFEFWVNIKLLTGLLSTRQRHLSQDPSPT